jgi:hypothetical protein
MENKVAEIIGKIKGVQGEVVDFVMIYDEDDDGMPIVFEVM